VAFKGLEALERNGYAIPPLAVALTIVGLIAGSVLTLRLIELPLRDRLRPRRAARPVPSMPLAADD